MSPAGPADEDGASSLGAARFRALVVALVVSGTVTSLVQSIVAPILPSVQASSGASLEDLSWLLTATLISGGVLTPVLTRLGDQFGVRRLLFVSLASMALGSLVCAVSDSLPLLIGGRVLQGGGMAVVPLGMAVLRRVAPFVVAMRTGGLLSASMGVGGALGLPVAAVLIELTDWHVMFWVIFAFAMVAMVLIGFTVPPDRDFRPARFDLVGALLLTVAVVATLLAVTKGGQWGWTSGAVLGLFAGAAAAAAGLWLCERRVSSPLIDLRLNTRPAVLLAHASAVAVGFGFYSNSLVTALLVQEPAVTGYGLGLSVAMTGVAMLPGGFGILLLSPLSARISAARSPTLSLLLGTGIMVLGYAVRFLWSSALAPIIVGSAIISVGAGFAYAAYPAMIQTLVPRDETAAVNGVNTLARLIGSASCGALITVILSSITSEIGGATYPTLAAYQTVFAVAGGLCLMSIGLVLLSSRSGGRS